MTRPSTASASTSVRGSERSIFSTRVSEQRHWWRNACGSNTRTPSSWNRRYKKIVGGEGGIGELGRRAASHEQHGAVPVVVERDAALHFVARKQTAFARQTLQHQTACTPTAATITMCRGQNAGWNLFRLAEIMLHGFGERLAFDLDDALIAVVFFLFADGKGEKAAAEQPGTGQAAA